MVKIVDVSSSLKLIVATVTQEYYFGFNGLVIRVTHLVSLICQKAKAMTCRGEHQEHFPDQEIEIRFAILLDSRNKE
jgi:hypothetical protein